MAIQIKDNFNLKGGLTLDNAIAIKGKTGAEYTNTNTSATIAKGTVIDLMYYNSSGNLHLGYDAYDNYLSTGNLYLSSPNNMYYRTRNTGAHIMKINDTDVFKIESDTITAKQFMTTHGLGTDTPGGNNVGTASSAFNNMSAKQFTLYPSTNTIYGYIKIQTEGSTSAGGETRFSIGNNIATGTAHNAKGKILIYGTNTGYTAIDPGNNSTSNITVELPSANGKIPIMKTDDDGYWGILPPTGSEGTWLRTPKSGLIPYSKNIADSSSLGTASWPWNNVHSKNFKINGVDQAEYGYLKVITEGTTDTTGEGRVMVGNGKATGTAGNGYGRIQMYGTNTGYTMITPGNNSTSNITLTLPSAGGTLARTADKTAGWSTARTLTIGATGKSVDGTGNVSWSMQEIMKGQGLNYDTACNTLYFNNAGTTYKGRVSVYNNGTEDFLQLGLCNADTRVNTLQLYPSKATITKVLYIQEGGVQLNASKAEDYYAFDAHRKCTSATDSSSGSYYPVSSYEYSTARFGCVNSFGGVAAIETRHNGTTVGYVRALPTGGIQIGSGKKLHIQASAPTKNVSSGDIWIDI